MAIIELKRNFGNDPQISKILTALWDTFSNPGIIYSYIVWLVFLTFYGYLHFYELVQKRYPKRNEDNLVEENYYLTLWAWGIAAIFVQHATLTTGTAVQLHIIGDHPIILTILAFILGAWGMYMLINGRVHIDGYWTNHIYKYPDHKVVKTGLYSQVRHPIYGGQFYITLSIFLAYNNYFVIFLPVLTAIYNIRRAYKEERALEKITSGAYSDYKKKCPNFMFHPLG